MTAPVAEFLRLQETIVGRYSLERELGRGGMGIVYLARDVALDRPIAIKLLPPALATQPELRQRFLREARTAAKLSHPNIVPIYSVEEHGDLVFFCMGYVDGESLGQRVRRTGPLPPSAAVRLVQEVAWALAYAHGRGVIHRDVKPDNILLEKGSSRAMVTDFGIARVADQTGITSRHEVLGTAHYMSPEQASGEAVDGRSDLYSLGVTAYFALTAKLPFEGGSLPAVLARVLTEPAPKVGTRRPDLPPRLAEAIDRCLAKDPDRRFAAGEALADAVGVAHALPREAPPEIRTLLRVARELDVYFGLLVGGWPFLAGQWEDTRFLILPALLVFSVFPALLLVRSAQRVVKAGLRVEDVDVALQDAVRARIEEDQAVSEGTSAEISETRRRLSFMLGLGLAMAGVIAVVTAMMGASGAWFYGPLSLVLGAGLMDFAQKSPIERQRRRALGWVLRLLSGRVGRWLFWLSGLGVRVERQAMPAATQHTEVLLGDAVEALFRALPTDVRRRFAAVPEAIERLERDAELLRERERAMSQALVQAAPDRSSAEGAERRDVAIAELLEAREGARRRLATAVAALENIRLDLLRLQAGVGSADDLTADLERAREINAAVSAELAGHEEVRRLLGSSSS